MLDMYTGSLVLEKVKNNKALVYYFGQDKLDSNFRQVSQKVLTFLLLFTKPDFKQSFSQWTEAMTAQEVKNLGLQLEHEPTFDTLVSLRKQHTGKIYK